jgi:CRISPR-associated protein Csx10
MTGNRLDVTVTARQAMSLGSSSEVSYFTDSHPFVPGTVLRGALAAAWIAEHGEPQRSAGSARRFRELFDGGIRFGPLYPRDSQRIPLSVLRCKYPVGERCRRVVVDQAFEDGYACPGCGQRLEPSKGELLLPEKTQLRRITRTSIDRTTMRAKDGELYSRAALPAKTVLQGSIFGRDEWLERDRTLRMGGRGSVGGAAEYVALPAGVPEPLPPDRVAEGSGDPAVLVVRLVGPAVFVDPAGRPRLEPHPDLDLMEGVSPDRSWVRPVVWSGWHAASRLPKPVETCAAPGSTYRFTGDPDALAALARRVLDDGIGLRRVEGFGVAEVVTGPWRGTEAPPREPEPTVSEVHGHLSSLVGLRLDPAEWAWLLGALRGMQIERLRGGAVTGGGRAADTTLDELMSQPTPARLSGRQRNTVRGVLARLSDQELRDLTTLVSSRPEASR